MLNTGSSSLFTDLGFVPSLGLHTTLICNALILSLDISHYIVHVQAAVVVHLNDDRYVLDLALELSQFLHEMRCLQVEYKQRQQTQKEKKKQPTIHLSYRIIHGSEELDLIL